MTILAIGPRAANLAFILSPTANMKAPRRKLVPAAGGFTLLEIIIALSIIVLMIGMASVSLSQVNVEKEVKEPLYKLREFAKRARNQAVHEQRPFQVLLTPTGIQLQSIKGSTTTPLGQAQFTNAEGQQIGVLESYTAPEGATLRVRPWGAREFPQEPLSHAWVFERSGLCEPIEVRVDHPRGWASLLFNALDAGVDDEASEIQ
jgi:prepilin-type N-terminal cleavage/methylation domain-containing protein